MRRPTCGWNSIRGFWTSGWAIVSGDTEFAIRRKYNVATIYKRARGVGRNTHMESVVN